MDRTIKLGKVKRVVMIEKHGYKGVIIVDTLYLWTSVISVLVQGSVKGFIRSQIWLERPFRLTW